MKNKSEDMIFNQSICAGASQIDVMTEANFASPRHKNAPDRRLI